ncbi:MAG: AraC family transcriptional regulator [Flavobacteriales bacterium]|nr:AraC family transcriptional regulator [Flavobacteriales bacterium]
MNTPTESIMYEITPLSDKDCLYIADRQKSEFNYPIHRHTEYELNFTEHTLGARRIVGDSIEEVGDYDLVLITGKELEHTWEQYHCKNHNIREITIQFSPDLFLSGLSGKNQFTPIEKMLEKAQKGIAFHLPAIMKVYPMLDTLAKESDGFYAFTKFMNILYELSRTEDCHTLSTSSFSQMGAQSDSRRVQKVKEYIHAHFTEELSLHFLSDMVGMTPVSFSRFFKQRTGKNLSDYITDIRLGHAARLLVDSSSYIADVCYQCGFNNLSNFNRIFKKKKMCSPKEFRENYRKNKKLI